MSAMRGATRLIAAMGRSCQIPADCKRLAVVIPAMSDWRLRLRRVRRGVAGLFAALVIVLAVAMALGQLLVPLIARYPDQVAGLLSQRLQQPVTLATAKGDWQASGPLLQVTDLRIGSGNNALRLPEAKLKVDFGAWLKADRRWLELRVRNASAHLNIDNSGVWRLSGFQFKGSQGHGQADTLGDLPVGLFMRDMDLYIHDERDQRDVHLHASELRVLTRGNRLRLGGLIRQSDGRADISLAAWFDPDRRSGEVYVGGTDVDLAAWDAQLGPRDTRVQSGRGRVQVWLGWNQGRVNHLTADFRLQDLSLQQSGKSVLSLPRWGGLLQAQGERKHWQLRWQPIDKTTKAGGWLAIARSASRGLHVRAHDVHIDALSPWLALWPQDTKGETPALVALRPYGRLDNLALDWRDRRDFALSAQVHGLGWRAAAGVPGIKSLDADLRGDGEAVSLHVPAQRTTFWLPDVFRKPFVYSRIQGDVSWWQAPTGWRLATDNLTLKADDYALQLRGNLSESVTGDSPVLDVAARVTDARVPAAKLFWPKEVLSGATMDWLDRGLVSGKVSGRALFRGALGDWPFEDQQGRFEAVADFTDTVLDYDADWPVAEALDGRAVFVNRGMHVTTNAGTSLGNHTEKASAEIARFHHPRLDLEISGHGQARRLLAWLRKTPVGREHAAALSALQFSGAAGYVVKLQLPLHDEGDTTAKLDGRVQLSDARLQVPDWSLDIQHLAGPLQFDTGGLHADALSGQYNTVPVSLSARVGSATSEADAALQASMKGQFDAASLLKAYPSLTPIAEFMQGKADFAIGLTMQVNDAEHGGNNQLDIDSNLAGMALKLPAPLDKPAMARRDLHVDLGVPVEGSLLSVRLGQVLDARFRLQGPKQPLAGDVALSGRADVPASQGIRIHGATESLDVSGWLQQILAGTSSTAGTTQPSPINVDIEATHTRVADSDLGRLALKLDSKGKVYQLKVDGESIAGQISIPTGDMAQRGITARLDHLHWPESDDSASDSPADDPAASNSIVAPNAIPPLHVWVKDLRLGLVRLGEVRFESVPFDDGMRVEQFDAQSPDLQLGARGTWQGTASDTHSQLSIDLSAEDLGRMLTAFGYPKLVAGGTTLVHIDGRWPGAPWSFSLADLDGKMKVHVADGRILEVDPGMGRLFGLFSIRELPRRLSLDFGDIFQAGYSFNSIDGNFSFADGSAYTDDLQMLGPSADIEITGRTGIRQHDYDQRILVTPHLGVAFPVVGAIAGGPIGAAAGLAVQGLLGKGINRAGQVQYKVSGSWDKAEIKRVARGHDSTPAPARTASVPPAPAQSAPSTR